MLGELKNLFKPEFLNRVDDIIVFHKLSREDTGKIAGKMLEALQGRLQEMGVEVAFTPEAVGAVAELGYDAAYGARPLRRVIQSRIEDLASEKLLEGELKPGKKYRCGYQEGEFTFTEEVESRAESQSEAEQTNAN